MSHNFAPTSPMMDHRRRPSFASIIQRRSLERAQSWHKSSTNTRTSLPGPSNLGPKLHPETSKRAENLIEHYSLRNDPHTLTLIILHRLPQSTLTSTHLARFLRFSKSPQYEGLTGEEIATIYRYLKSKPQNYYNPWKHLLDPTGARPLPQKGANTKGKKTSLPETLQHLLNQLEPATKYTSCVRAHRNLMYNSQLITTAFSDLVSTFSFHDGGWGFEPDECEVADYESQCEEIEDCLLKRRLLEASGEVANDDFWGGEEWSRGLGHPAFRKGGWFWGGRGGDVEGEG
ncbi:hypothetical protein N7G274_002290 [Stereocaulon virgatum]|uniref:Uncharacterized protein n=1 Tax=Stereocaulon virgatum TaxID=373712 RepID=A0ABR4AHF1_9LECA